MYTVTFNGKAMNTKEASLLVMGFERGLVKAKKLNEKTFLVESTNKNHEIIITKSH